jgi:hypothetical protein
MMVIVCGRPLQASMTTIKSRVPRNLSTTSNIKQSKRNLVHESTTLIYNPYFRSTPHILASRIIAASQTSLPSRHSPSKFSRIRCASMFQVAPPDSTPGSS